MDVSVLHWPKEECRRAELREHTRPRLLLVEEDAPAPVISDPLEDWIRMPASDADIRARVDGLLLRSQARTTHPLTLDDDGLLRNGELWVSLPPIEAALVASLLASPGTVVSRDDLLDSGWPDQQPSRNVLDVHVLRLRRRLEPIGVGIRTVRSRGYVLER